MVGNTIKIVRRDDGAMAAAAGGARFMGKFQAWFLSGEEGDGPVGKTSDSGCDVGVIFRPDGSIEAFEEDGKFHLLAGDYYAIGSGRDIALGAMFIGADADEAVGAAIALDCYTGGDITVLTHDEEPKPAFDVYSRKSKPGYGWRWSEKDQRWNPLGSHPVGI